MASSLPFYALTPAWDGWLREYLCESSSSKEQHDSGIAEAHSPTKGTLASRTQDEGVTPEIKRDAPLVTQLRDGDVPAYTTLFYTYYPALISFLGRYIHVVSDAEDLAQETMMLLWQRRETLDPQRSLRAFLFTIARHRALNYLGHRRRTWRYEVQVQVEQAGEASSNPADAEALVSELERVAAQHISELPPRQREIFQLSRGEGLSPTEIAEILGITTGTVYGQLARIAKSLHTALSSWMES